MASAAGYPSYERLLVSKPAPHVLLMELNRPAKFNAMDGIFWEEVLAFFKSAALDGEVRAIIVSAVGTAFCAGLDLMTAGSISGNADQDVARNAIKIRQMAKVWQDSFTWIEKCGKAVIACAHGACVGAGLEMLSACDIRYCSSDAYFAAAEVDVGLAADVGGLQRFPKTVGNQSLVRELTLTGRRMSAEEALQFGFVSRKFDTKEKMIAAAVELAQVIASKSPVATLGVKELLNFSRDHTVDESLDYAITWNMSMLQGKDMVSVAVARMQKAKPEFPNLSQAKMAKL